MHPGIQLRGLHWTPPPGGSFSKPSRCVPASGPGGTNFHFLLVSSQPTRYKDTIIVFILEAPLGLKLNSALKDLLSLRLGSVISGLEKVKNSNEKKRCLEIRTHFLSLY